VHVAAVGARRTSAVRALGVTFLETAALWCCTSAYDNAAEFWCANELMGVTVLHEGRLHLRMEMNRRASR
jgi:hypothetical protein